MEDMKDKELTDDELSALAIDGGFGDIVGALQQRMGNLGAGIRSTLTPTVGTASAFQWKNTTGRDVVIDRVLVRVNTVSGAGGLLAVGTVASDGNATTTTASNNLIDALDIAAATGAFDNITDKGTAGKSRQVCAAGGYVTANITVSATGFRGSIAIKYTQMD